MADMQAATGEFSQHDIARSRGIFRNPGDPLQAELSRYRSLVHATITNQGKIFGMAEDWSVKSVCVLESPLHQFAAFNRQTIVGKTNATTLLQLSHLCQNFALHRPADRCDRIEISASLPVGLVDQVTGHRQVVVDRAGIWHAGQRGDASGCRRTGAADNIFLVLLARIAQVSMDVDQSRGHQQPARIDNLSITRSQIFAELSNQTILNANVLNRIYIV